MSFHTVLYFRNLSDNSVFEEQGAAVLANALQHLSALTHLQLTGNHLHNYSMVALSPALQQLTGLREL